VLLLFGNITDTFTNRTFDLCIFNFTIFDDFCPPGVHLTPENFINEYKYVFYHSSLEILFYNIHIENAICQNLTLQYQILIC